MFSLLGCFLFKTTTFLSNSEHFYAVTEHYNFDDFWRGFMLIFLSSFDSIEVFMLEYMNLNPTGAHIFKTTAFFISYFFVCFILMLNLMLLIIIMQYDEFYQKKENPIEKFENIARVFNKYWSFQTKGDKNRIKANRIKNLLESFEENYIKEDLAKNELNVESSDKFIVSLKLLS